MKPMFKQQIKEILDQKWSDNHKIAAIVAAHADDRRDFLYKWMEIEKASGPKWIEDIKKTSRKLIENQDFGSEPEDVEKAT